MEYFKGPGEWNIMEYFKGAGEWSILRGQEKDNI